MDYDKYFVIRATMCVLYIEVMCLLPDQIETTASLKVWFIGSPFYFFFSNHNPPGAGSAAWHRTYCSNIWGPERHTERPLLGSTGPIQYQLYHLECPELLPEQPCRAGPQQGRRLLCLCWLSQPLPLLCQVIIVKLVNFSFLFIFKCLTIICHSTCFLN